MRNRWVWWWYNTIIGCENVDLGSLLSPQIANFHFWEPPLPRKIWNQEITNYDLTFIERKENTFGCKIYVFVSGKTSREQNSDFKYLFYLSVPFHKRQNKTLFSLSRILLNNWKVLLTLVKSFSKLSAIFSGALHWEYAFSKPTFFVDISKLTIYVNLWTAVFFNRIYSIL